MAAGSPPALTARAIPHRPPAGQRHEAWMIIARNSYGGADRRPVLGGIAGVLTALVCAQSWREQGVVLNHDVEIIEPNGAFPASAAAASAAFLTALKLATPHPQLAKRRRRASCPHGWSISPSDALQSATTSPPPLSCISKWASAGSGRHAAGIVSGIVGIIRLEIAPHGQTKYAGTTPPPLRRDALTAAAEIVLAAETLAQDWRQARRLCGRHLRPDICVTP